MLVSEFNAWLLFRQKYGPLTLHMRVDRGAALVVQAHRGGTLEKYMPWGKDAAKKESVPGDVQSPAAAVYAYTDEQLAKEGLYRDERGNIKRAKSIVKKRSDRAHEPIQVIDSVSERIRVAQEYQKRLQVDSKARKR